MQKDKFVRCFESCFIQAVMSVFSGDRKHDVSLLEALDAEQAFLFGSLTRDLIDVLIPVREHTTKLAHEYMQKMGVIDND